MTDIPYNKEAEQFNNDLDTAIDEMIDIIFDNFDSFIEEQVDLNINHDNDNFKPVLTEELKQTLKITIK